MNKQKFSANKIIIFVCFIFISLYMALISSAWFVRTQSTNLVVVVGGLKIQVLGNKEYGSGDVSFNLVDTGFELPKVLDSGTYFNQTLIIKNVETLKTPDTKKSFIRVKIVATINGVVDSNYGYNAATKPNISPSSFQVAGGWYNYQSASAWLVLNSQSTVTFCTSLASPQNLNTGDVIRIYIIVEAQQYNATGIPVGWV